MRQGRFFQDAAWGVVAVVLLLGIWGAGTDSARAAGTSVTATDLGTLGGQGSQAYRINEAGEVIGSSDTSDGQIHTFLWTSSGGMQDLGTIGSATELYPSGLSPNGQVTGNTFVSGADSNAFYWSAATGIQQVPNFGGGPSNAVAVNDSGQVAGSAALPSQFSGSEHALVWSAGSSSATDLGTLGGRQSEAEAMNPGGQVVGWSYTAGGSRDPFSWTQAGGMVDLDGPGFQGGEANAVNDAGQVVGDAVNPSGHQDAFLWTATDGMRDLGSLSSYSIARAISSTGQVIGSSGNSGFSWTPTAGMIDIGSLSGGQTIPYGVNDDGVVVGISRTNIGWHAFAWTAEGGMIDLAPSSNQSGAYSVNDAGQVVGDLNHRATLWQLPLAGFVTRSGTQLLLDGHPFRPIGVNIYNANSNGWCADAMPGSAVSDALTAIGSGKNSIRAWFFQQLATTDGARDWTAFDRTLAAARAHGIKVIATLIDQWGNCGATNGLGYGYKDASWYESGYTRPDPSAIVSYRDWVAEIVSRYKNDPTILAWQLVNEPEVGSCSDVPESQAASILSSFASDVSGLIKSIDYNHLVSLGTIGSGQCGTSGTDYQTVMSIPTLDLCEYHDYTASQLIPGDTFNGLALRINQCNNLGKPLLVGELGVSPSDVGGLTARANVVDGKLCAQLSAGIAGVLLWAWNEPDPFDITASDPVLDVLNPWSDPAHTCSAPAAPTGTAAAAGDGTASVSWLPPSNDGGSVIRSYTVTSNPDGISATVAADENTATLRGLTDGTPYTFTVTATNAAGTSLPSAPSAPVTPMAGNTGATGTVSPSSPSTVSTGSDPAQTGGATSAVTVPAGTAGGIVTITQTAASEPTPGGYVLGGVQIDVTAPAASPTTPLTLVFTLAPALGQTPETTELYRAEGSGAPTLVGECAGPAGQAVPVDPCVSSRQLVTINGTSYVQLTVLASTASHWNSATPKPGVVKVSDTGYSPQTVTVQPGAAIQWTFTGKKAHSVTDATGLGHSGAAWFDSGAKLAGTYSFSFPSAGSFTYRSAMRGDSLSGTVSVPVLLTPARGRTTTTFSVIWSTKPLSGYVFDVQYRFRPAGATGWKSWSAWKTGVTTTSAPFTPNQGIGTYAFHSRLRNTATGRASTYSADTSTVTVTS